MQRTCKKLKGTVGGQITRFNPKGSSTYTTLANVRAKLLHER
jgi:hypothetical protein